MKNIITLSEVADYFKKNKSISTPEEIDQYSGYFVTASTIAAAIIASNPVTALGALCVGIGVSSFRVSKLLKWLPDKFNYSNQGRDVFAKERYEQMRIVNFMLFDIAIKDSLEQTIYPFLKDNFESKKISIEDAEKKILEKKCKNIDKKLTEKNIRQYKGMDTDYPKLLIEPIVDLMINISETSKKDDEEFKISFDEAKEDYLKKVSIFYNAYLINFSEEFPEFKLWIDLEQKKEIIEKITQLQRTSKNDVEKIIDKIEQLYKANFSEKEGFEYFANLYSSLFKRQADFLIKTLEDNSIKENLEAHFNYIISETEKPLIESEDIEGIIFPKNKEAFIPHSYKNIVYQNKEHQNNYLKDSFWNKIPKKENIESFLLQILIDPYSATTPILILGNPGAGKSMLSKIFAGQLCKTTDFIPFYIKLRDVATSTTNVLDHVNKGIAITIGKQPEIDWLTWAKKFKNRIPVIILDGFDELLKSSNTDLNNYVNEIKKLQETALHSGICVRIILTSRLAVMDNVEIPRHSRILRLEPFDEKRMNLWVKTWNNFQKKKGYSLSIPKKKAILDLAQEPLLLFMLAVYDFENSELQKVSSDKKFNQSKLYDALMNKFTIRQLEKDKGFKNISPNEKENLREVFRLRLGMIAILMFLNDTTHKDNHELLKELSAFGLDKPKVKEKNILGGFFFIHENKSTSNIGHEYLNYEFLHKTFSEFLAADFLLRIAQKQIVRSREKINKKEIFLFCFGYNWLHKHHNIVSFLFEHANHIIEADSEDAKLLIDEVIKPDLENLFDKKGMQLFPISEIQLLPHKQVIEHLAIYSQNILLLWIAIMQAKSKDISFEIYAAEESIENLKIEYKHEGQDRTERNKNKLLWKRIVALWELVGNDISVAKLNEWVSVEEEKNAVILKKAVSDVKHYFSNSSYVMLNDFKRVLSFFDNTAYIPNYTEILTSFSEISQKKPELEFLVIDVIIYRFIEFSQNVDQKELLSWFKKRNLSYRQETQLIEQVIKTPKNIKYDYYRHFCNIETIIIILKSILIEIDYGYITDDLVNTTREITHKIDVRDYFRKKHKSAKNLFEYVRLQNKIQAKYPYLISKRNYYDSIGYLLEEMPGYFDRSMRHNPQLALEYLKLLNELKNYFPIEKFVMRIEKFFFRFFKEMSEYFDRSMHHNPQLALEYLKLLNELKNYFPIEKFVMRIEKFFFRFFEKYPTLKKMYLNNEGIDELLMLIKESNYEKYN